MILAAEAPETYVYRVEVSGWDSNREFFVENSDLEWSESFGKQITINHSLAVGTVIFLRLLQPMSTKRPSPVAYEAEGVSQTQSGQLQVRLKPVRSRPGRPQAN